MLYAPADAVLTCRPLGQQLRALAPALLSQQAVHRFLGYTLMAHDLEGPSLVLCC